MKLFRGEEIVMTDAEKYNMEANIEQEFDTIDLGDQRRNQRSRSLIRKLAANPQASINEACDSWTEAKNAYRFFDNPDIHEDQILKAHREATIRRIQNEQVVCVAQDTTELDYSKHPAEGLKNLDRPNRYGLYDHSHIAFTPEKLCLGVLKVDLFDREEESLGSTDKRGTLAIEEKESLRWLEGYRSCCDFAKQCPDTKIVSLADREGDIYDIFIEADQHETPADFVIRSQRKRSTPEKDPDGGPACYRKMRAQIAATKPIGHRELQLPQSHKRSARTAHLEVRACRMTLRAPHAKQSYLPSTTISVVSVVEISGPNDGTDVNWLLLSSLPVETIDQVTSIIDFYVTRWSIEVFFRVLKTGCQVEEIQLETKSRLTKALMFYKVIAWRILFLTHLGRECPELPCDVVFSECEWKSVWQICKGGEAPQTPPSLSEFLSILASLGGYNQRRHDGPPGPETIWRGMRRMFDFALGWNSFRKKE